GRSLNCAGRASTQRGGSRGNRLSPVSTTAAAKADGGAAQRLPIGDAAVEHRARVVARSGEHAGGDGCTGAALADRHDRPAFLLQLGAVLAHESVRDVAAAGDEAVVALVQLADIDYLRAVFEQPIEVIHCDGLQRLRL